MDVTAVMPTATSASGTKRRKLPRVSVQLTPHSRKKQLVVSSHTCCRRFQL